MRTRPTQTLTTYRGAAVAAAAVLALTVSGCATGFNAETNREYTAAVGTNQREGDVDVLNALYVENVGGTATLSTVLVDKIGEPDTLTGITVATAGGDELTATLDAPIDVEPGVSTRLGDEPEVVISGDFVAGQFLRTTLTFENAGEVVLRAPVVERTEEYSEVAAPSILPTDTASEEATDGPSDEATDQPTDEPTS
ncbi:MAG: hypothetical protein Q7T56_12160 [Nocardioidaceae bacterium]|nr:hypothetical protein [Nocardioidaceae bacterium]